VNKTNIERKNTMLNYNILDNLENETPNDLMSFKEMLDKHCIKYGSLYKWTHKGDIKPYYRGTWKVSESEVLSFCKRKAEEKLSKTRDMLNTLIQHMKLVNCITNCISVN